MKNIFWFAGTVFILIWFTSASIDWLSQPPAVQAAMLEESDTGSTITSAAAAEQPQPLSNTSPVTQIAVGLSLGLFGLLALLPVINEDPYGTGATSRKP